MSETSFLMSPYTQYLNIGQYPNIIGYLIIGYLMNLFLNPIVTPLMNPINKPGLIANPGYSYISAGRPELTDSLHHKLLSESFYLSLHIQLQVHRLEKFLNFIK